MRSLYILFMLLSLIPCSCAPVVSTLLETTVPLPGSDRQVKVYGLEVDIPVDATVIGKLKVGDSGFSSNCSYSTVLEMAKNEALKYGGNAIKITRHVPPGHSTCHQISATILRTNKFGRNIEGAREIRTHKYAILNIYADPDNPASYDLYLGDSILCRVTENLKTSVPVSKEGMNSLWAKVDSVCGLNVEFHFGEIYYLRCSSIKAGPGWRPVIMLVDEITGTRQFDLFACPGDN